MQQIITKRVQEEAWTGRKGDPLGIMQKKKNEFWPYYEMGYAHARKWDT